MSCLWAIQVWHGVQILARYHKQQIWRLFPQLNAALQLLAVLDCVKLALVCPVGHEYGRLLVLLAANETFHAPSSFL